MMPRNRIISANIVLILSLVILVFKLTNPTPTCIQGEHAVTISTLYTFTDCITIAILSGLAVASGMCLLFFRSETKESIDSTTNNEPVAAQKNNLDVILKTLKGKEQMIINELIKTGEINQSELSSRTKIPSSTLSRTLHDLEQKGLIVRYYNGMSKMVKLNDSLAREGSRI